jgi:hypothetical protein
MVLKDSDIALLKVDGGPFRFPCARLAHEETFDFSSYLMGKSVGYFGFFGAFLNAGGPTPKHPMTQPDELSLVYRTGSYSGSGRVEVEKGSIKNTIWFQGISTPGTSGGALLLEEEGTVIGVIVSQLRQVINARVDDDVADLSVAVPVHEVWRLLEKAAKAGKFPAEVRLGSTIRTR